MITKNRVILCALSVDTLKFASRFEAIEEVKNVDATTIEDVWARNKTPITISHSTNTSTEFLTVPELSGDAKAFIAFCYENGFECGEEVTGIKYDTANERCILCELASYKGMMNTLEYYNKNVEKEVDCIIYESPHFYVTSELGALIQGYLMIIPKQHILSVAQFSSSLLTEYNQVCKDVEEILLGAYPNAKSVTFMEHGSAPGGITSHKKSIVHAHTHVVVDFKLSPNHKKMVQLQHIEDIRVAKKTHYFSYQEGSDGKLMICMDDNVYVQRQFPRQVMADELKLAPGQYNWRVVGFEENVHATLYNIHNYLKTASCSGRIKNRTLGFVLGYAQRED